MFCNVTCSLKQKCRITFKGWVRKGCRSIKGEIVCSYEARKSTAVGKTAAAGYSAHPDLCISFCEGKRLEEFVISFTTFPQDFRKQNTLIFVYLNICINRETH